MDNISNKRTNDWIGFLKFFASICIMMCHTWLLGIPWGTMVLAYGWVYVELFFILTGYFTTSHFDKICDEKIVIKMERSLSYTVRKYLRVFPYTIITVSILHFIIDFETVLAGENKLTWFVYSTLAEALCLLKSGVDNIYNGTMWFLSAMFTVFPFYCFFLQTKNKYIKVVLSLVIGVTYYAIYGVNALRGQYHDLARAISCMCIGSIVFFVVKYINKRVVVKKITTIIATVADVIAFLVSAFLAINNCGRLMWVCVISFVIMCILTMSGMSSTGKIESKLFRLMGKLSIPIFLWQWPVGTIIATYFNPEGWSIWARLLAYCGGTIGVSIIHLTIVMTINKKTNNYFEKKIDNVAELIDRKLKAFICK